MLFKSNYISTVSQSRGALPLRTSFFYVLLCATLACSNFTACNSEPEKKVKVTHTAEADTLLKIFADSLTNNSSSYGIKTTIIEEGLKKATIEGLQAQTTTEENKNITYVTGDVKIEVFDEDLLPKLHGFCEKAIYDSNKSIFTLIDNVFVISNDSTKIYTDTLHWDQQDDRFFSSDFLILVSPKDSVSGYGLNASSDFKEYTFNKVSGESSITVNEAKNDSI